jgi:hypothetical protein
MACVIGAITCAVLTLPVPASATDDLSVSTSKLAPLTYTVPQRQKVLETLRFGYQHGLISKAQLQAELSTSQVWAGTPRPTVGSIIGVANPGRKALAAALDISMTHESQTTTYYCGPASGLMILKSQGVTKSKKTGESLTQKVLANAKHMNTETGRQTSWSPPAFANGLNAARGGSYYVHYRPGSAAALQSAVFWSLGEKYLAAGINLQETTKSGTYNYHPVPGGTRGHWLAIYGHSGSGATVKMHDPAGGASGVLGASWKAVKNTFSLTSAKIYSSYLPSPFGIAY